MGGHWGDTFIPILWFEHTAENIFVQNSWNFKPKYTYEIVPPVSPHYDICKEQDLSFHWKKINIRRRLDHSAQFFFRACLQKGPKTETVVSRRGMPLPSKTASQKKISILWVYQKMF